MISCSHTANNLIDTDLLEKETFCNRQAYYKPTEEAEILMRNDLFPRGGDKKETKA